MTTPRPRPRFRRPAWATGWLARPFYAVAVNRPEGYVLTAFWDGSTCEGAVQGNDPDQYTSTARYAGYGDALGRMAIENDLLHSFLAERAGFPFSCALYGTAHKRWFPWWQHEESSVFALQRLLNAGTLSVHERAALALYCEWTRPRCTLESLTADARVWLARFV